jgi:hypothetical protein
MRIRPSASNEPPVPAQQRPWPYQEGVPAASRQRSAQRSKEEPIVWLEPRLANLPTEDRQFVAENENLQLLHTLTTAEKHDQLEQPAEDDVDGGHKQTRPPADGNAEASGATSNPLALADRVYAPHGIAEAPSVCFSSYRCRQLSLTDFGVVKFSNAMARSGSRTGSISDSSWSATPIRLQAGAGRRGFFGGGRFAPDHSFGAASPSALTQSGTEFSVTWHQLSSTPSTGYDAGYPGGAA